MTRKFGWRVDRSTLRAVNGCSSPEVATQAAPPAAAAPTPTAPRKLRRLTPRALDDIIGRSCIIPLTCTRLGQQPSRRPAVLSLEHAAPAGWVPCNSSRVAQERLRGNARQDERGGRIARITATSRQMSPTAVAAPKADDAANAR